MQTLRKQNQIAVHGKLLLINIAMHWQQRRSKTSSFVSIFDIFCCCWVGENTKIPQKRLRDTQSRALKTFMMCVHRTSFHVPYGTQERQFAFAPNLNGMTQKRCVWHRNVDSQLTAPCSIHGRQKQFVTMKRNIEIPIKFEVTHKRTAKLIANERQTRISHSEDASVSHI